MNRFSQSDEGRRDELIRIIGSTEGTGESTEGTGECLAPMEDGRWLMSDV